MYLDMCSAKLPLPCYLELERRKAELSYWNGGRMNGLTIQSTLLFIAPVETEEGWMNFRYLVTQSSSSGTEKGCLGYLHLVI